MENNVITSAHGVVINSELPPGQCSALVPAHPPVRTLDPACPPTRTLVPAYLPTRTLVPAHLPTCTLVRHWFPPTHLRAPWFPPKDQSFTWGFPPHSDAMLGRMGISQVVPLGLRTCLSTATASCWQAVMRKCRTQARVGSVRHVTDGALVRVHARQGGAIDSSIELFTGS